LRRRRRSAEARHSAYIAHTLPHLRASGGDILFLGQGGPFLIGPESERWDMAMLVRQSGVSAFLAFAENEAYLAGMGIAWRRSRMPGCCRWRKCRFRGTPGPGRYRKGDSDGTSVSVLPQECDRWVPIRRAIDRRNQSKWPELIIGNCEEVASSPSYPVYQRRIRRKSSVMSLIGTTLKPFKAEAYRQGKFETVTDADVKGKWGVFFFYPADFTFVCPTELEDLADKYAELQGLGVEVYSVSTDTHFSHKAWADTSPAIGKIQYYMLGDQNHDLSNNFDILRVGVAWPIAAPSSSIPMA
jgi:peroxiredoxin